MTYLIAGSSILRRILDVVLLALIAIVIVTVVVARVVPMVTGGSTFVVGSGSMEPNVPVGAAVIALPVEASDVAVGDVVSLHAGNAHAVFTHRVTRLVDRDGALWIETKGDANDHVDPSITPFSDVIGRVGMTIPYLGYVVILLSTMQGVAFLLAASILVLAGVWLLETVEEDGRIEHARRAARAGLGTDAAPGANAA
jgi:signal peptidase I